MAIFGVGPYGVGTPTPAQDGRGSPTKNPYSGEINGSRKIDPATKDYVFDSTTGRVQGMTNAQQLVYLAVCTDSGSSAVRSLGNRLRSIDRITSNFVRRVDYELRSAVQHIVDRGIIEVVGTEVQVVRPGVALARLKWRDTDTGVEEETLVDPDPIFSYPRVYAPFLVSLDYDLADTAGGDSVTITGRNLLNGSVTVGGTSATVSLSTATSLTFTMPAKAAGSYNVQVTTAGGASNTLSLEAWSPAELTLTGRWAPSYSVSPWSGSVGGRNFSEATNPPSIGTGVHGYTPADFDGTNDILGATTTTTFYSSTAYSLVALLYIDSFAMADTSNPRATLGVLSNDTTSGAPCGGVCGTGSSGVFRFGHSDGVFRSAAASISTGAWFMAKVKFDGSTVSVGKNSGAMSTQSAGTVTSMTGNLRIGRPADGTANFLDGKMLYGLTANTALSDANFEKCRKYFNIKYALSL